MSRMLSILIAKKGYLSDATTPMVDMKWKLIYKLPYVTIVCKKTLNLHHFTIHLEERCAATANKFLISITCRFVNYARFFNPLSGAQVK